MQVSVSGPCLCGRPSVETLGKNKLSTESQGQSAEGCECQRATKAELVKQRNAGDLHARAVPGKSKYSKYSKRP